MSAQEECVCDIIFSGGEYRYKSNSLVGMFSAKTFENIFATKSIIGIDGLSVKHGITSNISEEVPIDKVMVERTRGPIIVVADHEKIDVVSNFFLENLKTVTALVTDSDIEDSYRKEIESQGVEVIVAESETM